MVKGRHHNARLSFISKPNSNTRRHTMLSFRHIISLNLSTMRSGYSTWAAKDAALRQVPASTKTNYLLANVVQRYLP